MNLIRNSIPNTITLGNVFCGFLGVAFVYGGHVEYAGFMILLAGILDFFDGFTARLLKAKSNIGEQLDSLADMVSFGVLPGLILLDMINRSVSYTDWIKTYRLSEINLYALIAFVFTAGAALRLAIFNTDNEQSVTFKGIPSPGAAIFVAAIPLVYFFGLRLTPINAQVLESFIGNPIFHLSAAVVLAALMVSKIPFFSFKFSNYSFRDNWHRYALLLISLPLLFIFKYLALILIITLYILFSIVSKIITK